MKEQEGTERRGKVRTSSIYMVTTGRPYANEDNTSNTPKWRQTSENNKKIITISKESGNDVIIQSMQDNESQ